ncbi:hypothetical protein PIB30_107204, partial [Stylosanthes scabra]|nr:hypothetical protein [Stylosanthes scabra]
MGFGALSNLPNYYLKQKVLKELFNRFDIYDNTIHAVAGEVEITTKKIGDALGLSSTGKPFPDKVVPKELSDEDHAVFKPDHEPPQQPRQLEQEETPIQQPEPQPQRQPPQDDVIGLSSCSDDEQPPHHMDVVHPLVSKVEKLQEDQPPPVLEQPSQSVVEVVPIYPTQEVIDVSSSSEDERPLMIPKTEQLDPYPPPPSAKIISEVLISMNRDEAASLDLGIDPPLPQREEAPSF